MQCAPYHSSGTLALSVDAAFSGNDFQISLAKYLAPMLYEADRSQLYLLPVENVQRLWFHQWRLREGASMKHIQLP